MYNASLNRWFAPNELKAFKEKKTKKELRYKDYSTTAGYPQRSINFLQNNEFSKQPDLI